jgi:TetR/AcrR family acrAB operon transcriptional repressor
VEYALGAGGKRQWLAPAPKLDNLNVMAVAKRRTQIERREEAEARIVEAAIRLVAERGYDGFTLNDVGEASGYSRGLPAHYFGSKDELLLRVADQIIKDFVDCISPRPSIEPGLPRLKEIIRQYCVYSRRPCGKALSIIIGHAGFKSGVTQRIREITYQGVALLDLELRHAIGSGAISQRTDVAAAARIIYAFLRGQLSFCAIDDGFDNVPASEAFISGLERFLGAPTDCSSTPKPH